jgi:hypothetical protein
MKANLRVEDDDWLDWAGGLVEVGEDMAGLRCKGKAAT